MIMTFYSLASSLNWNKSLAAFPQLFFHWDPEILNAKAEFYDM